ncbi:uncharacterized protein LOC131213680 [Anopheles bellator]|uniref:uncharacterized protein LOC131213680 n=1 Tax=Anopheles bellator TaxID=139047 RepID=UPI002647DE2E|nr:uncharacterized protein LOC131213680 [Anopheles bellator]
MATSNMNEKLKIRDDCPEAHENNVASNSEGVAGSSVPAIIVSQSEPDSYVVIDSDSVQDVTNCGPDNSVESFSGWKQQTNCSDDGARAGPSKRTMAESPEREAKQPKRSEQETAENLEPTVDLYADRRPEDVEHWYLNCKGMSDEEIIGTFDEFKDELYELYEKYKSNSTGYCVRMGLCSFRDCIDLMTQDQHCLTLKHLESQFVPEEQRNGNYTNFLVQVLTQEWLLRIFMKVHDFSDRQAALKRIREEDDILMAKLADDYHRNFAIRYNLEHPDPNQPGTSTTTNK